MKKIFSSSDFHFTLHFKDNGNCSGVAKKKFDLVCYDLIGFYEISGENINLAFIISWHNEDVNRITAFNGSILSGNNSHVLLLNYLSLDENESTLTTCIKCGKLQIDEKPVDLKCIAFELSFPIN